MSATMPKSLSRVLADNSTAQRVNATVIRTFPSGNRYVERHVRDERRYIPIIDDIERTDLRITGIGPNDAIAALLKKEGVIS